MIHTNTILMASFIKRASFMETEKEYFHRRVSTGMGIVSLTNILPFEPMRTPVALFPFEPLRYSGRWQLALPEQCRSYESRENKKYMKVRMPQNTLGRHHGATEFFPFRVHTEWWDRSERGTDQCLAVGLVTLHIFRPVRFFCNLPVTTFRNPLSKNQFKKSISIILSFLPCHFLPLDSSRTFYLWSSLSNSFASGRIWRAAKCAGLASGFEAQHHTTTWWETAPRSQ